MGSRAPDGGQSTRTELHPMGSRVRQGAARPMGSRAPDGGQSTRTELHPMGSRVRQGAARPDRSAPDGEQYTRWGAVHLDRTGAMHTDRVSCPHQQAQTRRTAACRDTRRRCGWLDSLRCVWGDASVGHRRGSRCVWGRWLPRRAHPRAGWIAVRVGRRRAWAINVDRGACGDDGRPTAHPRAGRIAVRAGGDASVGHRRGSWRSLCVSRRPRPCRCRDGCRETRAPGEPGRWPLRR